MLVKEGEGKSPSDKIEINFSMQDGKKDYKGYIKGRPMPLNTFFDGYLMEMGNFYINKVNGEWLMEGKTSSLAKAIGIEIEKHFSLEK